MDTERRIYLIKGFLAKTLNRDEEEELFQWRDSDVRNAELLEKLQLRDEVAERMLFNHRLQETEQEDWEQIRQKAGMKSISNRLRYILGNTAVAVILLGIAFSYFQLWVAKQEVDKEKLTEKLIRPGRHRAIVELANGETLVLGDQLNLKAIKFDGGELAEDREKLVVSGDEQAGQAVGMHKISVPRGGEYQLILADGTRVLLNSQTTIEFPSVFGKKERVVRVNGEAFFEVKHDPKRPFRVLSDKAEVRVLGTEFNINSYDNEFRTTLVQGSVELMVNNQPYRLQPGEQGVVDQGKVEVMPVNVRENVAWTEGLFVFRNRRLEEVLTTLARWYDLEVSYQQEYIKDLHFTGNIRRHALVKEVLVFIQETELVRFEIDGRTLIVSSRER